MLTDENREGTKKRTVALRSWLTTVVGHKDAPGRCSCNVHVAHYRKDYRAEALEGDETHIASLQGKYWNFFLLLGGGGDVGLKVR